FHAALASAACARPQPLAKVKAALRRSAAGTADLAPMAAGLGGPLIDALEALAAGRCREPSELSEPVRDIANRFGGSHAQRDILTLTLIEAARRSADRTRARHYLAERRVLKSAASRWGVRLEARA